MEMADSAEAAPAGGASSPGGEPDETLYYVTVLSNLIRGYDKYARVFDKAGIPESTFPGRFFLLSRGEIGIGVAKARGLLEKHGLAGDRLVALETHAPAGELRPNLRTGLGRYVERGWVVVDAVHETDESGRLTPVGIEEACARSLELLSGPHPPFESLAPRSVSILPVARACQARCPFCFSKASVSADVRPAPVDWARVGEVLRAGRSRGAARAVITGGGEPALLSDADLERLIREAASVFSKVVLISNGYKWGRMDSADREDALRRLDAAGLSVLALSRHHHDPERNAALMGLDTGSERVAGTWEASRGEYSRLRLRWICVLQRGGVEDRGTLERYLDWAAESGVGEVCFKELYVSTSVESEYYDRQANRWSAERQVPLRLVLELSRERRWTLLERLPWGAPVFEGAWRGGTIRVAVYTEPSLLWELSNGLCRSWNLMADGRCLASLEDRRSEVLPVGLRQLQTVP
jgi:molybdenum cofactor biosynthesis enzyme MoaA